MTLTGNKTYIVAGLTAIISVLYSLGYIDNDTFQFLLGLMGAGALGTVGAKINRISNDVEKVDTQVKSVKRKVNE